MEVDLKHVCSKCRASFASGNQLGAHKVWHCKNLKRKVDVVQEEDSDDVHIADGFDNLPNETDDNPLKVKCACH